MANLVLLIIFNYVQWKIKELQVNSPIIFIFCLFILAIRPVEAVLSFKNLKDSDWKRLERNEVLVSSQMKDRGKQQEFNYYSIGLHPSSCNIGLRKISRYEQYKEFVSFIKQSDYSDSTKQFHLLFDHTLLPFPFKLRFKVDRVVAPGKYSFIFEHGFLKGLKGNIRVSKYKKRCLYELMAKWKGPDTKINSTLFEIFSRTLGKLGKQKIFRISRF